MPRGAAAGGSSRGPAGEPSARFDIDEMMSYLVERKGSDLHLVAGRPPTVRIDGELHPIPGLTTLTPDDCLALAHGLMNEDQREKYEALREVDFGRSFHDRARFRINAFHQRGSASVALRLLPMNPVPFDELGLPEVIRSFAYLRDGLVVVSGPTGAGKSTTLAAIIDIINENQTKNIITIEDPIEYHHDHKRSIVQQRELERDTGDLSIVLRSVLREDPDVLLLGEMRDYDTVAAAITAAETGHLVFATLHTGGSAESVNRMIDVFPGHQQDQVRTQLAACLRAVVSQRLLPAPGGGRTCVAEVLVVNHAIANMIRQGKGHQIQGAIQTGGGAGMVSFDGALANAVRRGLVTFENAEIAATDPAEFRNTMKHHRR